LAPEGDLIHLAAAIAKLQTIPAFGKVRAKVGKGVLKIIVTG